MDFDDGFVAYLNGTEIASSGIGLKGEITPFDKMADSQHEGLIYTGKPPVSFNLSEYIYTIIKIID
jgi:hypothetical protein